MIQVLCQILQTESMQDIQSWLVSAGTQGIFYSIYLANKK